jgi:hypothetical protein
MTTTKTTLAPARPKPTIIHHPVLDMPRNVTGSAALRYPLKGPSSCFEL